MIPIVTAGDDRYLPGVLALFNSYRRNSQDGFSFNCLWYGSKDGANHLRGLGVEVFEHSPLGIDNLPTCYKYPEPSPAMYCRLLLPEIFKDHDYSVWIDADAVILKPLAVLFSHDLGDRPFAGTSEKHPIDHNTKGCGLRYAGIQSSLMVFNHKAWAEKGVFQKCADLMNENKYDFNTVVQGVLHLAVEKDWFKYPDHYQVQGGHTTTPRLIGDALILHFVGTNPWEEFPAHLQPPAPHKVMARNLWKQYA